MKIIDGTKAYVLGAKMSFVIGIFGIAPKFILGRMNLPKIVNPRPKTSCKEPKIQNQGPKNVHGLFLENNLIIVKVNKMIQRAAKSQLTMILLRIL